jgi:peptidoglycan hydrolase CwlO-like protein
MKAKEEIHDLGEDVDKLQHKIVDKVEDVRLEVMEELHELGEEISGMYQKIRSRF